MSIAIAELDSNEQPASLSNNEKILLRPPPHLSNSPPSFRDNEDDDDDENHAQNISDFNHMNLSDSLSSFNSNISLPKLYTSWSLPNRQSSPPQQIKEEEQDNNNNTSDFENRLKNLQEDEWISKSPTTPTTTNIKEEEEIVDSSNWANFNETKTDNNHHIDEDLQSFNENKKTDDDDDDDWGNFVEIDQTSSTTTTTTTTTTILHNNETISTSPPFNIDNLVNEIFLKSSNSFINDNGSIVTNLIIDSDEMWQQIQTFTTVTDASNSLQFKWCSSNLEDNYLKALSLDKINHNKNYTLPTAILQPVKIDSIKPVKNNNSTNLNSPTINSNEITKSNDLLTTPALVLDLAYFESNNRSNNKHQETNGSLNKIAEPNSKVYLDKLLEDIFTTTNQKTDSKVLKQKTVVGTPVNSTSDDLFSDKKSLSSSASSSSLSSSSNTLNELTHSSNHNNNNNNKSLIKPSILQLQPSLLEKQHLQTTREYDEKALETISKLSNFKFKSNSKVMIFPR